MVDWRSFLLPRYFCTVYPSLIIANQTISPGMNGIFMYLGHQGAYALFPFHWKVGPMNSHFERLVETLWGVTLWIIVATYMYHKKIFFAL